MVAVVGLAKESELQLNRKSAAKLVLLVCIGLASGLGLARTGAPPVAAAAVGPTVDILEGRIQQIESSTTLDEGYKALLLDLYRKSLGLIKQRQSYEANIKEFVGIRERAPQQAAEIRQQIEQLEARPAPELPASLAQKSLAELELLLQSEKVFQSGLRASLTEFSNLLEAQSLRSQQVRERLERGRIRQAEIADEINIAATSDLPQPQVEARLWALQLETHKLTAEIEMLNQELLSQPMRMELYGAQRDKASLEWDRQQRYVELIGARVSERRISEADSANEAATETERQSFGKHPLLQDFAQSNTTLSNQLNQLATQVEETSSDEIIVTDQIKRFSANYQLSRQKLEIAGLNQALGEVLLQERNNLPRSRDFSSAEKHRQQLVVDSSLRRIQNQQERLQLSNLEEYIDTQLQPLSDFWKTSLRDEIRELALQRRELLDKLIATDDSLLQALGELDFAQRELSNVVSDYNRFLDERLLWVRTGDPPSWQILESTGSDLALFFSADNWQQLFDALFHPQSFPWLLVAGLLLFALLLQQTPALRASLRRSGRKVGELRHDRFRHSIRALIQTLVLALPWPVLFTALGLHLQLSQNVAGIDIESQLYQVADWSGQLVPSIGNAFSDIALYTFYFAAFRVFCDRSGLAVEHFQWSSTVTELLRRETRLLMAVFLPAMFLLVAIITYQPAAYAAGISRVLFCVIIVSLAWFFGRILSPSRGALGDFYRANPGRLMTWLRYFWFASGLMLPVLLALLAIAGYMYTAANLGGRMVDTLWLIVAIILIHQLLVRWVVMLQRQLEFRDALDRHRAQRVAREAQEEGDAAALEGIEEPEIDFHALSDDTKKLINSGLIVIAAFGMWAIWSEVLPAFHVLDEVSLWSYKGSANGVNQLVPVTLGDLITALLIIVLGSIAARRLPALLEIALFARFNITAGSRYAISKLTQYSIIAAVILVVFSLLGGRWSEIHWLVAALGVGIGFGLQEIIANFICGLILLFERPIRIGDTVTVGETTGTVTKIRIRSTTIRNWDHQELLVPNKEFITGRLLNWTLTDPITRIIIVVGIAYGSDIEKALRIMLASAEQHERVLEEPPPQATFDKFGDNSLEIALRCYIGSMDYWLTARNEINQTINREMAAAGISIAFPQRDVHLDTSQPLDIHLHRAPRPVKQT